MYKNFYSIPEGTPLLSSFESGQCRVFPSKFEVMFGVVVNLVEMNYWYSIMKKKRDKWQKIKIKCVCVWLISITKPHTTLVGFHDIDWTSQTTREKQNKNRKKKCIMRRKRKQYRLRFDWKSLENCLHFINTVLNTIKWLRSQLSRSKRFYFSLFHYIIIHL